MRRGLGWCYMWEMNGDEGARLFDGPRKAADHTQTGFVKFIARKELL